MQEEYILWMKHQLRCILFVVRQLVPNALFTPQMLLTNLLSSFGLWFVHFFIVAGFLEGYAEIFMKSYFGISWLVYAALGKGASTLVKYFMQAFHNYNRQSVTGVSPLAIAIDLSEATLALIKMQLDSSIANAGFFLFDPRMNLAKFLLCLFSGTFDAIILI